MILKAHFKVLLSGLLIQFINYRVIHHQEDEHRLTTSIPNYENKKTCKNKQLEY